MGMVDGPSEEPTPAVWQAMASATIDEELLERPPDLFALTDVIREREAARCAAVDPSRLKD
jgi:hypothetical protein